MLTIAGNVVKYLRYWKTALKNRAFRCSFQREGDGESPSASLFAASLERPRESAAGASRYRSAEMCASTIRVVPRLTSPLSWGRGFIFVGADAHIGPAERTVFSVIFGEFVTSQWADVGIGPYRASANSYCFANFERKAFLPQMLNRNYFQIRCTVTGGAYHSVRRVSMCVRNTRKSGFT